MGWNVANMVTNYRYDTKWSKECIEVLVNSQWAGVQNRSCADETVLNFRAQQCKGWFLAWFGDPLFDLTRINTTLLDKYCHQNHFGEKNRAVVRFAWPRAFSCVEKCRFGREGLKLKMDGSSSKKGRWSAITTFFFKQPHWSTLAGLFSAGRRTHVCPDSTFGNDCHIPGVLVI